MITGEGHTISNKRLLDHMTGHTVSQERALDHVIGRLIIGKGTAAQYKVPSPVILDVLSCDQLAANLQVPSPVILCALSCDQMSSLVILCAL